MRKPTVHCWKCGPDTAEGTWTFCLLTSGHTGPHDHVPEDEITITPVIFGLTELPE